MGPMRPITPMGPIGHKGPRCTNGGGRAVHGTTGTRIAAWVKTMINYQIMVFSNKKRISHYMGVERL